MIKITVKDVEDNIQDTVFFSGADGYNGQHFRSQGVPIHSLREQRATVTSLHAMRVPLHLH